MCSVLHDFYFSTTTPSVPRQLLELYHDYFGGMQRLAVFDVSLSANTRVWLGPARSENTTSMRGIRTSTNIEQLILDVSDLIDVEDAELLKENKYRGVLLYSCVSAEDDSKRWSIWINMTLPRTLRALTLQLSGENTI